MAAMDNTFQEAMHKILQQLAVAGTLPDADVEFVATVQAAITQRLREGAAQGQPGVPQGGAPDMSGGAPPGMGGMAPAGPGGPMPGLTPSAPNMDEIRRMVGATGQVQ